MKKNFTAAVIAMTLVTAGSAYAADGTVEFTGKITETACTITQKDVKVDFGTVSKTAFTKVGDVAGAKGFEIAVSACPETTATVRFDADSDSVNSNLFALGGASTATGVAIALFDHEGGPILPRQNSGSYGIKASGNQVLSFTAKLESTAAAVTEGDIKSSADFTIVYK